METRGAALMSRTAQAPSWPLFAGLGPLGVLGTVPRLARSFCQMVVSGWGLTEMADDCELVVSELTSNVVRAAAGTDGHPLLWVRLLSDRARIRLEVWDTVPLERGVPLARKAADDDESGRGLDLIDAISDDWGWDHLPAHGAKRVWALLPAAERNLP